jgi:hypothetical protein
MQRMQLLIKACPPNLEILRYFSHSSKYVGCLPSLQACKAPPFGEDLPTCREREHPSSHDTQEKKPLFATSNKEIQEWLLAISNPKFEPKCHIDNIDTKIFRQLTNIMLQKMHCLQPGKQSGPFCASHHQPVFYLRLRRLALATLHIRF